jgi:hypothetical protein
MIMLLAMPRAGEEEALGEFEEGEAAAEEDPTTAATEHDLGAVMIWGYMFITGGPLSHLIHT